MILELIDSVDYSHFIYDYFWLTFPVVAYYVIDLVRKRLDVIATIDKIPGLPCSSYFLGNANLAVAAMKQGCDSGEAILQCFVGFAFAPPFNKSGISRVWMGPQPLVILFSPETAEDMLSSNKIIEKAMFYDFIHSWVGTGLLTATGDKWRSHRKMLTPAFHFRILEDFLPVINNETKIFVEVLKESISKSKGLIDDISKPILNCALDTVCETAMGVRVDAQRQTGHSYVNAVHKAGLLVIERLANPILFVGLIYAMTASGRQYRKYLQTIHDFTNSVIRRRKEQMSAELSKGLFEEKQRMVFMDTLIYQHLKDPKSMTEEEIREEVDTFMFEGHDTTGWGMTWATYLTGLYPEVQEKIHEELDSIFADDPERAFTMDDLREMKYLECVIKEAQRLFPSVPFYGRKVIQEAQVAGYTIPAGTTLGVFAYQVHRDPRHWPNPEHFIPERFFSENCAGRHPFAYIPFSAGPRNCIGQKFAMLETKAVLASLFRNFKVTSLDQRDKIRTTPAMIIKSQTPLRVKLELRNAN